MTRHEHTLLMGNGSETMDIMAYRVGRYLLVHGTVNYDGSISVVRWSVTHRATGGGITHGVATLAKAVSFAREFALRWPEICEARTLDDARMGGPRWCSHALGEIAAIREEVAP